jgi:hypothetical protein
VSEETRNLLGPRFEVEELAPTRIRGKDQALRLFNIVRAQPISQVPSTSKPGAAPKDDAAPQKASAPQPAQAE